MGDEFGGNVNFKFTSSAHTYTVEVLPNGITTDDCRVVISEPEGFFGMQRTVKKHWLGDEKVQHNPKYVSEQWSRPKARTTSVMY